MKKSSPWFLASLFIFGFLGNLEPANAKVFRNSYISFELPTKWDCYLDNTAWICRYAISKKCLGANSASKSCQMQRKKTKEAIIILAAKEVGPKDSLRTYYDHMKKPRPIVLSGGKRTTSKIIHVKQSRVNQHTWIDGMHLGSEIPHYYTRYLSTIKGNIAVLVTFSAHKLFYTKYSSEFFRAIKSMRVIATKAQTSNPRKIPKSSSPLGDQVSSVLSNAIDDVNQGFDGTAETSGDSLENYLLIGAAILALLGAFVWFRGRKR